jgi:phosphatidylinositol glycan class P protein
MSHNIRENLSEIRAKKQPTSATEHSPAPQPERAIYGFFLLVSAIFSFIIYLVIAFIPETAINQLGWDYLPDKYWSIALPAFIILSVLFVLPFYFALNVAQVNELSSAYTITDEQALDKQAQKLANVYTESSIDPIYDIPIDEINTFLFSKSH